MGHRSGGDLAMAELILGLGDDDTQLPPGLTEAKSTHRSRRPLGVILGT